MKIRIAVFCLIPALLVTGCTVQKTLTATGGSKADGTVRMAYTLGLFEKPVVNWQQGATSARARCVAWGYSDAEAFGGEVRQCQVPDGMGGCNQWLVSMEYQCTGQMEKEKVSK